MTVCVWVQLSMCEYDCVGEEESVYGVALITAVKCVCMCVCVQVS